ncbi:hypothetical protein [Glycomyces harbinensis]|uniref:Uncharacterized protein n=1 Tax=Glycomyces harbinensis TaxID=58114 RepID=A0A1G6V7F1_9ACTN|nr:hypothetical protein [Glycomyces harbinensis]SDD49610.1 hypothetical protein SAMN05216270_104260 [Glycomyces harbinensis]
MSGLEVDPDDLIDAGEITLPYAADFYDEMANRAGAIGDQGASGLLTLRPSPAGNALGEAIVRCHRFLYAVTEQTADSHRAVALSVAEAGHEYRRADEANAGGFEMTGEELTGAVAADFTEVDAGEYESDSGYRFNNFDRAENGSGYEDALSGAPRTPADPQDYEIDREAFPERTRLTDRGGDRPPLSERDGR